MNVQNLNSPKVKGILLGIIVAFIVTGIGTPLGFALVVGIIFGLITYVILNDAKKNNESGTTGKKAK
jgi:xanthine/uracil/vitamin C permease (AzgA family)